MRQSCNTAKARRRTGMIPVSRRKHQFLNLVLVVLSYVTLKSILNP
jgi:hypothetical protein